MDFRLCKRRASAKKQTIHCVLFFGRFDLPTEIIKEHPERVCETNIYRMNRTTVFCALSRFWITILWWMTWRFCFSVETKAFWIPFFALAKKKKNHFRWLLLIHVWKSNTRSHIVNNCSRHVNLIHVFRLRGCIASHFQLNIIYYSR